MRPEICPNCGAEVPKKAKACPECGSDEETGWGEDAYAGGLGLPDEEFDYDAYVKKEFENDDPARKNLKWYYIVGAFIVILAFLAWFLKSR
jgi:hypothetical protein